MRIIKLYCLLTLAVGFLTAEVKRPPLDGSYVATAYAQKGITKSGDYVHRHVVAADPDILPIGSRIKVKHAGKYSGEYVVADTGSKIQGRRLDIFLPSERDCVKFGRKRVKVRVIEVGDGTHQATKEADLKVKEDVKNELNSKAVGAAATEQDWAVKKAVEKKGVPPEQASEVASKAAAPAVATSDVPAASSARSTKSDETELVNSSTGESDEAEQTARNSVSK